MARSGHVQEGYVVLSGLLRRNVDRKVIAEGKEKDRQTEPEPKKKGMAIHQMSTISGGRPALISADADLKTSYDRIWRHEWQTSYFYVVAKPVDDGANHLE